MRTEISDFVTRGSRLCGLAALLGSALGAGALAQDSAITQKGNVTVYTVQPSVQNMPVLAAAAADVIDYVNAKPLELPIAENLSEEAVQLEAVRALTLRQDPSEFVIPLSSAGSEGAGGLMPVDLGAPAPQGTGGSAAPAQSGTAGLPFSTARADLTPQATNEFYPYRASGKLFFRIGTGTFICSGSLIDKGLVATAAHCVSEFGERRYHSDWRFAPGYRSGVAPFGIWSASQAYVLTSYFDGGDSCDPSSPGVVCENDIAVLVLDPQPGPDGAPLYPGTNTGWYSYGWNKAGFTGQDTTHVTQIGYPGCLDDGAMMERNDSQAFIAPEFASNTVIGSLMCGGSSGGGWFINFGIRPNLTGTSLGSGAQPNMLVGITSWGSTSTAVKHMGSSPVLETNLPVLVKSACDAHPDACEAN